MTCGHCKRESPSITVRVSVRANRTGDARVELDVCSRCYRESWAERFPKEKDR